MLRFRSNWSVMLVVPKKLADVISVTPAIRPNWRSSGVATDDAMISGLSPGKPAPTEIVGKSICGRAETGRARKATAPDRAIAAVRSVVATGRRINGEERLIASVRRDHLGTSIGCVTPRKPPRQPVEENVNYRRRVQRKDLAQDQPAHHRNPEWSAELRTNAGAKRQRNAAKKRRHRGHHDRAEPKKAGFIDRVFGLLTVLAFRFEGEVDHHNPVLLYDPDQQDDSDQCHHAQFLAA